MTPNRAQIRAYREWLNSLPGQKHRHGRFHQRSRPYGDYLYHQDREKFMVDLVEWLQLPYVAQSEPAVKTVSINPTR